jgi:hypothetical protein
MATVAVEQEASVVVVTLEAEEASVVVVTLEAAAEAESEERASQVEFRTLMAEDPAPLHLGRGSLFIPAQSADR